MFVLSAGGGTVSGVARSVGIAPISVLALPTLRCGGAPGPGQEGGRRPVCRGLAGIEQDAHYGKALLTRLPVGEVRRHDLSVSRREPRAALEVVLESDRRRLQFIATHLGLRPAERREQVRRLLPLIDLQGHDLVVLAGDLNEWFLWGRPLRMLHRIFPDTPHRRSWPAHTPLLALDRIWVHPRHELQYLKTHRSVLARIASYHLPLVAEIGGI